MVKSAINVLMIEDLQLAQVVAVKIFDKLKCHSHVVSTAAKALEQILMVHFDIIFIDIQLPDINGFSLAQTMRSLERRGTRIPLIAVTANHHSEDLEKNATEAGFDDLLFKPLTMESVEHVLQKHLSGKQLQHTGNGKGSQDERRHAGNHKHHKK